MRRTSPLLYPDPVVRQCTAAPPLYPLSRDVCANHPLFALQYLRHLRFSLVLFFGLPPPPHASSFTFVFRLCRFRPFLAIISRPTVRFSSALLCGIGLPRRRGFPHSHALAAAAAHLPHRPSSPTSLNFIHHSRPTEEGRKTVGRTERNALCRKRNHHYRFSPSLEICAAAAQATITRKVLCLNLLSLAKEYPPCNSFTTIQTSLPCACQPRALLS